MSNTNHQLQTRWFSGLHHPSHCGCSLDQHQKTVADHLKQLCFLLPQIAADCLTHHLDLPSSHQETSFQLGLLLHQQIGGSKPQGSALEGATNAANYSVSLFCHPNNQKEKKLLQSNKSKCIHTQ